ncbi:MAG: Gfo/Idh/MocA family oxidoreductase [Candidatus Harrisonbacteria bacterium]|nr:Gfo/Idh/MocA family oxidoreductase [Candidatus Harrisonbacteria bacterium]
MKFLLCGIGSMGQRHFRNLNGLRQEIALFRSKQTTTPFIEKFFEEQRKKGLLIPLFYDLELALTSFRPDAVVVANPNSLHMPISLAGARAGCHLFIEKPVSHTMDQMDELTELLKKKNLIAMVGYNLRFHPLLQLMKRMYESGEIGRAVSVHVEVGENIEDWHPWEDYRDAYACWKSGGGGVTLCFSHDIDYLYWFFGMPERVQAIGGKKAPLGGDAEDTIKALMEFRGGLIASLHMDYWQRPKKRTFEIIGTLGRMMWDCGAGTLVLEKRDLIKKTFDVPKNFDRNDMFISEMKNFILSAENKENLLIPFEEGVDVLRICIDIKKKIY